jgi:DnaK suppressor protein
MDESTARACLAEERARAEEELARLRAELHERERDAAGELGDYDQHPADSGTELAMRMDEERRIEDLEERLAAIARAERRLEQGTYGRSVASGVPIPDARLMAVPWAEYTVEEELAREASGHLVVDPEAGVPHPEETFTTPLDDPEAAPAADEASVLGEAAPATPADEGPADEVLPLAPAPSEEEEDDEIQLDAPGAVYRGEGGHPRSGRMRRTTRSCAGATAPTERPADAAPRGRAQAGPVGSPPPAASGGACRPRSTLRGSASTATTAARPIRSRSRRTELLGMRRSSRPERRASSATAKRVRAPWESMKSSRRRSRTNGSRSAVVQRARSSLSTCFTSSMSSSP